MSINAIDFEFMQKLVAKHSAIVLEKGKEYLLEARLTPIAKSSGISDLTALVQLLRDGKDRLLLQKVIEAMTTNETFFFRDVHPFEALKKVVLPQIIAKKLPGQMINIWCAASSTGQEPYSIAMLISDNFPQLKNQVKLYASDIAPNILEKAKRGLYSQLEVNRGLPVQLLVKYFTKAGADWQIKDEIRHWLIFV